MHRNASSYELCLHMSLVIIFAVPSVIIHLNEIAWLNEADAQRLNEKRAGSEHHWSHGQTATSTLNESLTSGAETA